MTGSTINMTRSQTGNRGKGVAATPTGSNAAFGPDEFAQRCQQIVQQHEGHTAHRMLDNLVTDLLSSLGYSEGMAIFIAHVRQFHPASHPSQITGEQ